MAAADRIRIRELWFAHNRAAEVRALDPGAEQILGAGKDAGNALLDAVSAVLAEELDDGPIRAGRDRIGVELRQATANAIRRFRALVGIAATDPTTGAVVNQGLIDQAEALADTYLPNGNLGGLAPDGPALQFQARLVTDALGLLPECATLAANLGALVDAHRAAMDRVMQEAEELKAARQGLEAARVRADALRKAGWHYLHYLTFANGLEIDVRAIYPVASRSGADDPASADATLDAVGAPDPESAAALPPEPGGADAAPGTPPIA